MKCALLIFFAAGTLAAPFLVLDEGLPKAELKGVGCSSSRFRQGKSYAYDYAGETLNKVEGASKQWTGLKLTSRVFITPLSECKFSMKLSNSELYSKSRNQEFSRSADSSKLRRELEKYELLFTMSGDKIHSLVAHDMESVDILNMKRGILSTLQVDKEGTVESDVNGVCDAIVTEKDGKLVKEKNLNSCSKRAQNVYGIQVASFKTESSMKPLDSTSKCTYTMDGDNIKDVNCKETHIFRPFSAGYKTPSGAMTIVRQSLKRVSAKAPIMNVEIKSYNKKTTLVFDHSEEESKSTVAMANTVESIMSSLVKKNSLSAKQDSAHEFTALVMVLRKMNKKAMRPIWDKYFDCIKSKDCTSSETDLQAVYRQYLLDAIAYCGTSTCVSFVRDVIIDGVVGVDRVSMFLQSIALVGHTTKDMIKDVLEIAKRQPSRQAFLSLGTLMYRHCSKAPKECEFDDRNPVSNAEVFLENKLGDSCNEKGNYERVEEILMALKALGNAHRPLRVRPTLLKCAQETKHSNITQSALNAFQNMPCDAKFTDKLLAFIKNKEIDPEKRIHAFTAAMKCPTEYVLEHLIKILEEEPSKQMASFMWSHLSNIMESSEPQKQTARKLLLKLTKSKPLRVVNMGVHQYSRFFEKSLHSEKLQSGATAEGEVIYHPDGYFPRTGKMNVRANVLGKSIEVFETLIHVEGMEDLLEDALGPNGLLPKDFLVNIFNFTMTAEKLREFALQREERSRGSKMGKKLNNIHETVNMKPSKPTAHFNIKVMGQEMTVVSYDDLFWMIDQIDNSNVIQTLVNVAKGGHKTFSKSMMFLEMSHIVPTGLGLPLKLKLTGSTVTTVELDGKFDIRNMFWGPGSIIIKGYVKPSAVVEVAGQMGIESAYGSSGIFVNTSMFVSHLTKGNIIYKAGQLLKINVDTPEEPVQLFNVSSSPFIYMNEEAELIEGTERRITPDYCLKSKIIGYGLCTSLRLPFAFREYEAPYFPLTGPAHFGVNLVRGDEGLTTYQFQVKMEKKGKELVGDIEFSTPGAYYERRIGGKMIYKDVSNQKTLTFSTERNGKSAQIQLHFNPNTRRSYIEGKTNLFSPKEIISKLEVFNTKNPVSDQYGLSYTLTYDWYKFGHVTKFVKKDTGYMLLSSVEYYPKKIVKGVMEYSIKDKKLSARFDADQFKQSFELSGQLKKSEKERGIRFTGTHLTSGKYATIYFGDSRADGRQFIIDADILSKKARSTLTFKNGFKYIEALVTVSGKTGKMLSTLENGSEKKTLKIACTWNNKELAVSNIVITNVDSERSISMSSTVVQKTVMSKIGYYKNSNNAIIKAEADVAGRKAEMFVKMESENGLKYTLGGIVGRYSAGVQSIYKTTSGKEACMSIYYGRKDSTRQPGKACVNLKSLSTEFTHKRLSFAIDMEKYGKVGEVTIEAKNQEKTFSLSTSIKYKGNEVAKDMVTLKYAKIMDSELKYELTIAKYNGGFSLFTRTRTDEKQVGFEVFAMDKTFSLVNRIQSNNIGKNMERSITTEVIVNGKTLPVSTTFNLITAKQSVGTSAKVTIAKYALEYATKINYAPTEYSLKDEIVVSKETTPLARYYRNTVLQMAEKKQLSYKFGLVAFGKTYEYGWEAAYQNSGSVSKSAHVITLALQYSTTRKSSVSFTLTSSKKSCNILIDFEYVPGKTLSHSIIYNRNLRQLDVTVEFLPKMFTKFMARVDKNDGYKFTTDFSLQWKKFKRSLNIVNTMKNTKKIFTVATNVGDQFKVSMTLTKTGTRSLQFGGRFMKHTIKITTKMTSKLIRLSIVKNARVLINVGVGLSKVGRSMNLQFYNRQRMVLKLSGDYNRFINQIKVYAKLGRKELISFTGRLNKGQITTTLILYGKPVFKISGKRDAKMVSVKFAAPTLKRDITFAAQLNRKVKSIILSVSSGKHRIGTETQADWTNKVFGMDAFYNDKRIGMKTTITKSAIVYKLTLAPKVSMKVTLEIKNDRILSMKVERQAGPRFINEFQTQFRLSRKMSEFVLNWNNIYFRKLANRITPVVKNFMKDMTKTMRRMQTQSTKYIKTTAKQMKNAAFDFVDNVDNKFDSIDFIKIRNKVGKTTLTGIQSMSSLVQKAMRQVIRALKLMKKELPGIRKNLEKATLNSIKYLRTLPRITERNMKEIQAQLDEIKTIFMKIATNLTESSRPVVMKAIELAKKFKLRGKTMEELVVLAKQQAKKYIKIAISRAETELKKLETQAKELYKKTKQQVLKTKIPYRKETVKEVIEIIQSKLEELKERIESVDAKELMENARDYVMKFNLKGKPVKAYIEEMKSKLNELKESSKMWPRQTRQTLLRLIKLIRKLSGDAVVIYKKVAKFGKPLTDYVVLVKDSAEKRFGPLYRDASLEIKQLIGSIELPKIHPIVMKQWRTLEKFFTPLMRPIVPLANNIISQLRDLRVMGLTVGTVLDINFVIVEDMSKAYYKQAKKYTEKNIELMTTYVEKYAEMTPEEIVEKAFDYSAEMSKQAIDDALKMYKSREEMMKSAIAELKKMYKQLVAKYEALKTDIKKFTSQSPEKVLQSFYRNTEKRIVAAIEELTNIAKQLADLEVSKHTWKAWKQADLLGHLDRYGFNGRVSRLIKLLKDVRMTRVIKDFVKLLDRVYNIVYSKAFVNAAQTYQRFEKVYDYVRSIPKKEYDEWYNELRQFTLQNKESFIEFILKTYQVSKVRALKTYELTKTMSLKHYDNSKILYNSYAGAAKKVYSRVSTQSQLFYEDIKEPSIQVSKHYYGIAEKVATQYYKRYHAMVMKLTAELKTQLENQYQELKTRVEKEYAQMLSKYGDFTWEDIAVTIVNFGEKKAVEVKNIYNKQRVVVEKLIKKYRKEAEKQIEKAKAQYRKYLARFNDEVKPKIMEKYDQLKVKYQELRVKVEALVLKYKKQAIEMINKAQSTAMTIYNKNKDKTLKVLYLEIKKVIVNEMNKQYKRVATVYKQRSKQVTVLATEYYRQADTLLRDSILPELKYELVSIINQTLKNSVIMTEELFKAYTPHFNLIKRESSKYSGILMQKVIAAYERSLVELNRASEQLKKMSGDMLEQLKEHKYTKQAILKYKKALKHEYVLKVKVTLKKLIKIIEDKINEIKAHPTTKKLQRQLNTQVRELNKLANIWSKKAQKQIKVIQNSKRFKRTVIVVKQVKKSVRFTVNKIVERVRPHILRMMNLVKSELARQKVNIYKAFVLFREQPHEAFWLSVSNVKENAKSLYLMTISLRKDDLNVQMKESWKDVKTMSTEIVDDIFDEPTKQTAKKAFRYAIHTSRKVQKRIQRIPRELKDMMKKAYKENLQALKQWYKQTAKSLKTQWKNCPYSAIVHNEIWRDISQEILNHELTDTATILLTKGEQKYLELKALVIKEYNKQQKIITKRIQEFRVQLEEKYTEMRTRTTEHYKKLVAKYNELVKKANDFVETTTIVQIVEYGQVKYQQLLDKIAEAKTKLIATKKEYVRKGRDLYQQYKAKTEVEYQRLLKKLKAFYKKHVKPVLEKQQARAMDLYNNYYPKLEAKYNELRDQAKEKYAHYSKKTIEMYKKYKAELESFMKNTKQQAHKRWLDSNLRSALYELKAMTIRETIEALKLLPGKTRSFIMAKYNKYNTLARTELNKRYTKLIRELNDRRQQLDEISRPYTVPAMKAMRWVENEVKETAIFIWRYHHIHERALIVRKFVTIEAKRLFPILKDGIKRYAKQSSIRGSQFVYDVASSAGDNTLRGIHSTMKYIDNIDVSKHQNNVRNYIKQLNKYVTIDVANGEIVVRIPHPEITPSIQYHVGRVENKARKTVRFVRAEVEKVMKQLKQKLVQLKKRAGELKKKLQQQVMENTVELRRDLKTSLNINKKLAERLYHNAKLMGQKIYTKAQNRYKILRRQVKVYMAQLSATGKQEYAKLMKSSRKAYIKASNIIADIYSVGPFKMHTRTMMHAKKLHATVKRELNRIYRTHRPTVVKMYRRFATITKTKAIEMKRKVMPYYQALRKAVMLVRAGVSIRKAFKPIYHQLIFASRIYQRKVYNKISEMKNKFCRRDPKLCKLIRESSRVHEKLFKKYSLQVLELIATGKAHVYRAVRKITKCTKKPFIGSSYTVAASLFGNKVVTFDKRYYELVENNKQGCGYLLAHDFSNNQFTLKKEGDAIVIETLDMSISINKNGKTRALIGGNQIKSLPVQSKSGHCIRKDSLVVCDFAAKHFKVVVDLKNDITTLSISGWYYGKTQGILGTYNRESYDDWKLPSGKVTNNIYDFINAYEVSGKPKCQMKPISTKPKPCNQAPSPKCEEIFKSKESQYAPFFETIQPEPFWQSCVADTSMCGKKYRKDAYCKSVAAFAAYARASGKWIKFLPECMSYKGHEIDAEFNQKPLKNAMDVVVLVSQRRNQLPMKKNFIKFLTHLHAMLKRKGKQNIKYSMVGFGGQGINEKAHIRPMPNGYDIFGNLNDVVTELNQISFKGHKENSNDAYHAILKASTLRFRPGASKVFILFNNDAQSAHEEGPVIDEVKYAAQKEAEATLIVFDNFSFKKMNKRQGQIIGQSTRKVYTTKHWQKGLIRQMELPSSEYKTIVQDTEGAMFLNKMSAPKHTAGSAFDVLTRHIQRNKKHCKVCKVVYSWTGHPKVYCQSKQGLKC